MFNKIINNNFKRRFIEDRKALERIDIMAFINKTHQGASIEEDFKSDNQAFRDTMFKLARLVTPRGSVACFTYAAGVSLLLDKLGFKYDVYAGLCIPQSLPSHDKDVADFKARIERGDKINLATHIYLVVDGKPYEYYSGEFTNITKVHVVIVEVYKNGY